MQRRAPRNPNTADSTRCGVALVEGAVVGSVFLLTLFVSLDIMLSVLRHNALSEAARCIARAAIVRGEQATSLTPWGPEAIETTMSNEALKSTSARGVLVTMNSEDVHIRMEWPDGDHRYNDRVRVTLSYEYKPLFQFGLSKSPIVLRAVSTMRITR